MLGYCYSLAASSSLGPPVQHLPVQVRHSKKGQLKALGTFGGTPKELLGKFLQ